MSYLIETRRKNPETGREEIYFRIGTRTNGKQQTLSLGFVNRKDAEKLLKIHEGQQAAQDAAQRRTEPPSLPEKVVPEIAEFLTERFLPHVEASGLARKSIISAQTSATHIKRLLGSYKLDTLDTSSIDRYTIQRKDEGVRTRTIQIELGHLRQLLELAARDKHISECPTIQKPRRTDQKPHRFHTPEESAQLLQHLPWETEPSSALAIYTAIELGMRSGEILSRQWQDIRWKQGTYGALWVGERLNGEGTVEWNTKTRKGRTIPLTEGLRIALASQWARLEQPETGWIFASNRNKGKPITSFKASLKISCQKAGIPIIHPHALRHSWATRMAITGIPKAVTMGLGGWRSPAILEGVYQHSVSTLEVEAIHRASLPNPSQEDRTPSNIVRLRKRRES